jgi:hypothetical protein
MTIIQNPFRAMEARRADIAHHQANAGGEVTVTALSFTSGWGEFSSSTALLFGYGFVEMPAVGHCAVLDPGQTLVQYRWPLAEGLVQGWLNDDRGYYTGVFLAAIVRPSYSQQSISVAEPSYTLTHTWTFQANALRDIPQAVMGDF